MQTKSWFVIACFSLILGGCWPFPPNTPTSTQSQSPRTTIEFLTGWRSTLNEIDLFKINTEIGAEAYLQIQNQDQKTQHLLPNINHKLIPLGYHLSGSKHNRYLFEGNTLLTTGSHIHHFETSERDFILCADTSNNRSPQCRFKDKRFPLWERWEVWPKYATWKRRSIRLLNEEQGEYWLFADEELLYKFTTFGITTPPILGLEANEEGRRLSYSKGNAELEKEEFFLIHNGHDLIKTHWRDTAFGLTKRKNQIFYFFQQQGKIWYVRGDHKEKLGFEEMIHDSCCSLGMLNTIYLPDFMQAAVQQDQTRRIIRLRR